MRNLETKSYRRSAHNQQVYHNGTTYHADIASSKAGSSWSRLWNLLYVPQSITGNGRVGDKIYAMKMDINLMLSNKLDHPNTTYRVVVVKSTIDQMQAGQSRPVIPTDGSQWSENSLGISHDRMFESLDKTEFGGLIASGDGFNVITGRLNSDIYQTVYDRIIQPGKNQDSASKTLETSTMVRVSIPFNKTVTYRRDFQGGDDIVNFNNTPDGNNVYAMFVYAYDAYGTLLTSNVGSFSYTSKLTFKDA